MISKEAVEKLLGARESDPFAVLGPHTEDGRFTIRALQPGARAVEAFDPATGQTLAAFEEIASGLFEGFPQQPGRYRLRVHWEGGVQETEDPYRFATVIPDADLWLLAEGTHLRPWTQLGAHPMQLDGASGTAFAVWAPNAVRVSVVGDFNGWDGRRHMMRNRIGTGIWEIFVPDAREGDCYKYEIATREGTVLPLKSDPFALRTQLRPNTASVIARLPQPPVPLAAPASSLASPISIYEVHAGSWKQHEDGSFYTWQELAGELVPYVQKMGFTHIELLPVSEHPFDGSWGYQTMGLYSPTARLGDTAGFADFVSACHRAGISVIVDWVPAHFPRDESGLARFDGTPLYEYADPREGEHKDWGTYIYNLRRPEVVQYLAGNALFWCEAYGVDGLRVDAVASMLYRDYSRRQGEWIPNEHGGRENLEAIAFLKRVNNILGKEAPHAATYAEESTAWPRVSHPVSEGGLGFRYKWNMGWMHDVLNYMKEDPVNRKWHHDQLTFGLMYAWSEHFVLPLSHDEVVHGKCSLIEKMPGDDWKKFAGLRAMYGFMWAYPGKKLLFMGGEIAQRREWSEARGLDWMLLEYGQHAGVQRLIADLNKALRDNGEFHRLDCSPEGFEWLTVGDRDNSVVAFARHGAPEEMTVVVCNFTPLVREHYRLAVPRKGTYREILNTDSAWYTGSNVGTSKVNAASAEAVECNGKPLSILVTLPPLSTVYLKWQKTAK